MSDGFPQRDQCTRLFDDFARTDTSDKKSHETKYAVKNRYAHPSYDQMRDVLENWFKAYPESHQKGLCQNFRGEDRQHEAAFFELYLYTLLWKQNFAIEIEPPLPWTTKRIDFLASLTGASPLYLEVTVARDAEKQYANQGKLQQLWEALNTLDSPNFWIRFELEEESATPLPPSQIRTFLDSWLQGLDIDTVWETVNTKDRDAYPERTWKRDGWEVIFSAIPKPPEDRNKPGETVLYNISPARWVAAQNSLLNALESKAKRYGTIFQHPFIIAVDVLAIDSIGCDIAELFWGKEIALYNTQTDQITWTRAPLLPDRPSEENGFWLGRSGARNKHVSAVLLVDQLGAVPELIASQTPILWHNPWAVNRFNPDCWQGPQRIPNLETGQFDLREGKPARALLQLPLDWPGNGPL